MTNKNIRASLLATVIVGMLSGSAIAADRGPRQGEPPRINAATMGDQQSFSRFIVTYRDGAAAKNNRSAIARNMAIALSRAGLSTKARPANASYMRKLAIGSDLVKTSRKLDRAEAAAFMKSEENTSELQTLMRISYAVVCLKKKIRYTAQRGRTCTIEKN